MSSTLYRMARACFHARKRVLAAWIAFTVLLGILTVTARGTFDDGFRIPGANSQVALDQLKMTFPEAADSSATLLVIAPAGLSIQNPAIKTAVDDELKKIEQIPWVKGTTSPYNEYVKGMVSDDDQAGYARIRVTGSVSTFTEAQREILTEHATTLQAAIPGSQVHMGGEVYSVTMPHVSAVEAIGLVVALIVLVVTLGSLLASSIPLIAALAGAGQSIMLILIFAGLIPINSTSMMLALMLALAVGIDYSLFIVSRHRDQLAGGLDVEESAARATATAGSAVVFAGLTVIIALVGLSVAGIPFLSTMGIFAAVSVAIEVALALTLLPAMLGFFGERLRPQPATRAKKVGGFNASRWWVGVVTKYPIITIVLVVAALGALSVPAKDLWMALPNSGRSHPGAADRVTFDQISEHYGVGANGTLVITAQIVESTDPLKITDGLKADIESMPGVKLVAASVPNRNADTAMVQVIPTTGPDDPATSTLVKALRDREPEWRAKYGVSTAVTGFTAIAIDVSDRLAGALLPFGLFVVGLSLVLLTVVFRSIWVPVKAALGYLLSVGAAFGATTLVFNKGLFKEVINLPEAVPVISFLPIVLMGILFGLAMDYEVFLTSRMREEFVHGNTETAVEEGFVHSAKVVVAAGLIMFAVFAFFVPAGEGVIKPIAFGLAIGIAIDAFVVRMTLGPAVMKLLGRRAWWLPAWLDARLPVMDIEGEALAHQLSLADWPVPDAPGIVYTEGLAAAHGAKTLFSDVDLELLPGNVVVVTGPEPARKALLLALSGRLVPTSGRAKVLGYVIPQQNSDIRNHTTFVDGADASSLAHLGRLRGEFVVVEHADRLEGASRAQLAALASDRGRRTLVLSAAKAENLADIVTAGDGVQVLELPDAAPAESSRPAKRGIPQDADVQAPLTVDPPDEPYTPIADLMLEGAKK
ncbi:MMPL family transporter [Propioniciclava tarda]|uniref:MMPL family transporter n=1 Tax=Propioniciclava tarda TaxID=433330 RepID=A0A4Q9KNQ5_PROTD|nr:MMPL family transporter [Propioniciclava tarda]TBT96202.1 MMPL family transporter [Propioniciclava tarda]SMO33402.1 putative drug exporter of the RND superfamily [Propioniciclava tarda]